MNKILSLLLISSVLLGLTGTARSSTEALEDPNYPVKISPTRSYADVMHQGQRVRIMRNQDLQHRLEGGLTRTSRQCPPFCIQPAQISPSIKTVAEIEVIDFLQQQVAEGKGVLVDVRMPRFYDDETIPGAVNIPFLLLKRDINDVLPLLGARKINGEWDFSLAKSLLIFCNGPWCSQSVRAIEALRSAQYPSNKLNYYRGGMQIWKLLGLSTISPALLATN